MAFVSPNFITAAIVALIAATIKVDATPRCNTGPIQCCNQVFSSESPKALQLLAQNGIGASVLTDVTGMVGAQCTPVTAIGVGSGSHCSGQTVCCQKNNWNGVVAVGCNPINIGV